MSDHEEETPAVSSPQNAAGTPTVSVPQCTAAAGAYTFSFTELHDRTGNTSCSTFDVRTKGHQNVSVFCGLGYRWNRLLVEKMENWTSHSCQLLRMHRCSSQLWMRTNTRADCIPQVLSYAVISRSAKWIPENHRQGRQPFHSHRQFRLCS